MQAGSGAAGSESLVRLLETELRLTPREVAGLRAFARACLDLFAEECGGLDPAVLPDPRHVACLLLEEG